MRLNSYTIVWRIPFAMSINKPLERFALALFFKLLNSWKCSPYNQYCPCPLYNYALCPTIAFFANFLRSPSWIHVAYSQSVITLSSSRIVSCVFHEREAHCKLAFIDSHKNRGNIPTSHNTIIFSPNINVFFHHALHNFSSLSSCAHLLQNSSFFFHFGVARSHIDFGFLLWGIPLILHLHQIQARVYRIWG